jgi:hypothetical protein
VGQTPWPQDVDATALRRAYYCAAFNALCAMVLKTQSQEKFFSGLVFRENVAVWGAMRVYRCMCVSVCMCMFLRAPPWALVWP